jgi:hypothetical protein
VGVVENHWPHLRANPKRGSPNPTAGFGLQSLFWTFSITGSGFGASGFAPASSQRQVACLLRQRLLASREKKPEMGGARNAILSREKVREHFTLHPLSDHFAKPLFAPCFENPCTKSCRSIGQPFRRFVDFSRDVVPGQRRPGCR